MAETLRTAIKSAYNETKQHETAKKMMREHKDMVKHHGKMSGLGEEGAKQAHGDARNAHADAADQAKDCCRHYESGDQDKGDGSFEDAERMSKDAYEASGYATKAEIKAGA